MSLELPERIKASTILGDINQEFALDVWKGLTSKEKFLPSKYLYNKRGDEIFQEIMAMPEYYLTRAEYSIFSACQAEILHKLSEGRDRFQLIEFGAGDGMKTKVLLQYFVSQHADFSYIPIDISSNILAALTADLKADLPDLEVQPICNEYFKAISQLNASENSEVPKVILFLGANIGNFNPDEGRAFLQKLADQLSPRDQLMIGFDLKKDPAMILDAYFDKAGITKAFKLNLLERINEELGANFNVASFQYFPVYNPMEGAILSYLVSQKEQNVFIKALEAEIHFDAWEAIFMERSQKFSLKDIELLADDTGFQVVHNFFDEKHCFTDSLWELRC